MGISYCKSICSNSKSRDLAQAPPSAYNNFPTPSAVTLAMIEVENQQRIVAASTSVSSLPATATTSLSTLESKINQQDNEILDENEVDFEEFIEKVVCLNEVKDNELTEIAMDDDDGRKIIIVKQNEKISAFCSKSPHYGAQLIDGVLGIGRIRCQNGSCFNIENGEIEDFPALDSLPHYKCTVENGLVTIRVEKSELANNEKLRKMRSKKKIAVGSRRGYEMYVIIGGGPAALQCAETLRMNNFNGRILMICKENHLPYDRMKLSKNMNIPSENLELRTRPFYDEYDIELFLNTEATSLDIVNKEISLSSGTKLIYDKVFIATGSRAKMMENVVGHKLGNIFTLRSMDDSHRIDESLKSSSRVVIIGSSFIALESAAYISERVSKVIIIQRNIIPLMDIFGEAIGRRIMDLFIARNVEFILNVEVEGFVSINQENDFSGVKLNNGEIIRGDVCIVAIGSCFNTDFLHDSGLLINSDGSIAADLYLQTSCEYVWVGGDIAKAPIFTNKNESATIGHFSLAQYHGKIAALNMLGLRTELRTVPYFTTEFFGKIFTFTGFGKVHEIFIEGDLETLNFVGFYFDEEGFIVGMSSCQPDKSVAAFAEKLYEGHRCGA